MPPPTTVPTAALAALSVRMHECSEEDHAVVSALGLWLLLALTSDVVEAGDEQALADILGRSTPEARSIAEKLLTSPHPAVASAAALWTSGEFETDAFRTWATALPSNVERGPVPTAEAANAWAREKTNGLISQFPLAIDEDTFLVLASALATRVAWQMPFELVEAHEAPGAWPAHVGQVLRSPKWVRRYVIGDGLSGIGDVAVHEARSDDLLVVSVAASEQRTKDDVLESAHRIAAAFTPAWAPDEVLNVRSLFDLELGEHACWDLHEAEGTVFNDSGRSEVVEAYLPAWHASSQLNLSRVPGVSLTLSGIAKLMRPHPKGEVLNMSQGAVADFDRVGFAAAAVTAMAVAGGGPPTPRPGTVRTARLHFDRPHAVVATALDSRSHPERESDPSPWTGLPVFSAWVTEAVDAS